MTDTQENEVLREDSKDIEQLTSYLDGELSDSETQEVERRIAIDAKYRLQMQSLQQTWDLLDVLPSESADSSFTRTTMEMVVDDARREIDLRGSATWKRPLKIITVTILPIALFAGSYLFTRQYQLAKRQHLVDVDLPVVEKMDHYLAVDKNIEFLESLYNSLLFSDESTLYSSEKNQLAPDLFVETAPSIGVGSAPADNLARLEAMDAHQRDSLRRKRERFEKLSSPERESLREFHEQVGLHSQSVELRKTLNDYYDWLGTLRSRERAELTDMPVDERLNGIGKELYDQARREFGRAGITQLPPQDARNVFDWYDESLKANERRIKRQFAELVRKQNLDKSRVFLDEGLAELLKRPINQLAGALIRVDRDLIKEMLYANRKKLRDELSDEALQIFDDQTENGKKELLLKWTDAANQTRSQVTILQLQRFYEQLSTEERDELDRMSFENWEQTLTKRYREALLASSTPTNDLSDERGVQDLIEASGLEAPDRPEDEVDGITEEDVGMPITLEIESDDDENDGELKMVPEVELVVPNGLIDNSIE